MSDFELTQHEQHSTQIVRLVEHLNERLDEQRRRNDAPMPPDTTAHTRGRIAELKAILDVLTPKPATE